MYLDIFKQKSDQENLRNLQIMIAMLSSFLMVTIVLSEATSYVYTGLERAIVMMTGFWLFCLSFQPYVQKLSNTLKLIVFLIFLAVNWMGIFVYFALKY